MTRSSDYIMLGLTRGSMYALVALGYTLVYGVLQLINFAHSEVFMFGAFGSYLVVHLIVGDGGKQNPVVVRFPRHRPGWSAVRSSGGASPGCWSGLPTARCENVERRSWRS